MGGKPGTLYQGPPSLQLLHVSQDGVPPQEIWRLRAPEFFLSGKDLEIVRNRRKSGSSLPSSGGIPMPSNLNFGTDLNAPSSYVPPPPARPGSLPRASRPLAPSRPSYDFDVSDLAPATATRPAAPTKRPEVKKRPAKPPPKPSKRPSAAAPRGYASVSTTEDTYTPPAMAKPKLPPKPKAAQSPPILTYGSMSTTPTLPAPLKATPPPTASYSNSAVDEFDPLGGGIKVASANVGDELAAALRRRSIGGSTPSLTPKPAVSQGTACTKFVVDLLGDFGSCKICGRQKNEHVNI